MPPTRLNAYLIKSTVVAALGGLLFGFDTAVIAGTTGALTEIYHLSPAALGLTVSSALGGTILGAMFAGIPGDRYGRRDSLRVMAVFYLIPRSVAPSPGIGTPLSSSDSSAASGSVALRCSGPCTSPKSRPAKWRGRLVGFFQFNVVARNPARLFLQLPRRPGRPRRRPNGAGS